MEYLYLIALTFISYICYDWFRAENTSSKNYPPCPLGLPIIGNVFAFLRNDVRGRKLSDKYGGTFMINMFQRKMIFLCTWADIKEAFINQAENFASKTPMNIKHMKEVADNGFLFLGGSILREKRRFTMQHLRNLYIDKKHLESIVLQDFQRIVDFLDKQKTFCTKDFFLYPLLNITWSLLSSKTFEFGSQEYKTVTQAINDSSETGFIAIAVGVFPILRLFLMHKPELRRKGENGLTLLDYLEKEVAEHEKYLNDGVEPRDYIDGYLLEIRKQAKAESKAAETCYTRRQLICGLNEVLQAGLNTTHPTLEWSLLYMAAWPEIQKKVQCEIDTVIGRNRMTTYSDREMLPYTRAVIMEIQRFCSVASSVTSRVAKRTTMINNYTIPKGALVIGHICAVHFDKNVWDDPEIFRPERFLSADGKILKLDGWIPFSLGPRNCAGDTLAQMELFLYFTGLMQRYSFRNITGRIPPSLEYVYNLTFKPNPAELYVRLR